MPQNPNNPLLKMARTVSTGVSKEATAVRDGFKNGTTSNKVTVLGGISTGVTFALQGVRNIRSGLTKDAKTGKRDLGTASVGLVELTGGLFLTGVFYNTLRHGTDIFASTPLARQDTGGVSR